MTSGESGELAVRGLSFAYAGKERLLGGVDLVVKKSEIVGVMGPSGCGKTTLLKIMAGFLEADDGEIVFDGASLEGKPPQQRPTSMVFQDYALFPYMSVRENVEFGLLARGVEPRERGVLVGRLLEALRLEALAESPTRELSGGQRQRVALGRALAVKPAVVLLDEPFSAVDESLRDELRVLVREVIKMEKRSAILVSHSFLDMASVCDCVAVWRGVGLEGPRKVSDWLERPEFKSAAELLGIPNIVSRKWLDPELSEAIDSHVGVRWSYVALPEVAIGAVGNRKTVERRGQVSLKGVVAGRRWRGNTCNLLVRVEGQLLEARVKGSAPPPEGARVSVAFEPEAIIPLVE